MFSTNPRPPKIPQASRGLPRSPQTPQSPKDSLKILQECPRLPKSPVTPRPALGTLNPLEPPSAASTPPREPSWGLQGVNLIGQLLAPGHQLLVLGRPMESCLGACDHPGTVTRSQAGLRAGSCPGPWWRGPRGRSQWGVGRRGPGLSPSLDLGRRPTASPAHQWRSQLPPAHTPSSVASFRSVTAKAQQPRAPCTCSLGLGAQGPAQPASLQCPSLHTKAEPIDQHTLEHTHRPQTSLLLCPQGAHGAKLSLRREEGLRPALPLWGESLPAASREAW